MITNKTIFIILLIIVLSSAVALAVVYFTSNKNTASNSLYETYLIEYASKNSNDKFKFVDGSTTPLLNDLYQKLLLILPDKLRGSIDCNPNTKRKLEYTVHETINNFNYWFALKDKNELSDDIQNTCFLLLTWLKCLITQEKDDIASIMTYNNNIIRIINKVVIVKFKELSDSIGESQYTIDTNGDLIYVDIINYANACKKFIIEQFKNSGVSVDLSSGTIQIPKITCDWA